MSKKDKKEKKGNKGKTEQASGPVRVETAKDDYFVVTQLAKAVEGKEDGQYVTSTLAGDLIITLKTSEAGLQRKTYKWAKDKTNTRVTVLRQQLRDAKEDGTEAPPKDKKDKKDKKGKKKDKKAKGDKEAKEPESSEETNHTEFLKEEELEAKYKVKKAVKAVTDCDFLDKKMTKKIVKQWGDAKKVTGNTIVRTVTSVFGEATGEQVLELIQSI